MTWVPLNLAAPEFATRTPPPEHVGLIYRGRRHLLSGPPESLKTLLAWIVGRAVVRAGGVVACLDFEQGPNVTRELLENLGWTLAEIGGVYYVEPDHSPDSDSIEGIVGAGVTLAIIDSAPGAFEAAALDDNARKDAEKFARSWIEPLYRKSIATLLIDHVTKNAENRGKYAIGSERKVGGVDVHLGAEVVTPLARGGSGLVKVRVHKDRPGWLHRPHTTEIALHSDPLTHAIGWSFREPGLAADDNGWKPTALMEKVSRFLEKQTEPVSRAEVERQRLGKSRDYVRQAMDALVAEEYATEAAGDRGARLLTSVRPFRDTSPDLAYTSPGEESPTSPTSPSAYRHGEVAGEDEGGEVAGWLSGEDIPLPDYDPTQLEVEA